MKSLELVENDDSLEKDLEGDELLKKDVKNIPMSHNTIHSVCGVSLWRS